MSSEVVVKSTSPTAEGELVHDSEEYESAEEIEEEYEEEEEIEEIEVEVEEDDEEDDEEAQKDDEGKEKQLDDDEDRKNPQFIPKKGYFYEHDDRMTGEPGEEEVPEKEERPRKDSNVPKVKEKVISDRWAHDLFDENEQAPKSSGELEDRYGYDIRSDDMAPRARRKRVYGRGPTKYTRNWEEEEAYHRPRGGFRGRRAGTRGRDVRQLARRGSKGYDEDFPQLAEDSNPKEKENEEKTGDGKSTDVSSGSRVRTNEGHDRRGRGGTAPRPRPDRREEDDGNGVDDRDRSYGRGSQGRTGRGRGGRRNEFANRNRYPDRRGSAPNEANNTSNNRVKSREEREWEQKVDRMREQDRGQKQTNGTRGNLSPSERGADSSNNPGSGKPQQSQPKKTTLPFTNTEYTGSASLTANRNQEQRTGSNFESQGLGAERDNISIKVINAGPEQGSREIRISDKDRPSTASQNSGMDRRSQPSTQSRQQSQPPPETAKPKRFSTQRQKQDATLNATQVSASPPPVQRGGPTSSPQPMGVQMASNVPASVMSGYPTPHSQTYYEQVPVQMPTSYDGQGYEGSGSPITVPITAHGQSVSPSLWTSQHSAYSTSPYPSPPTGPAPSVQPPYDPSGYISGPQPQIFAPPPPHPHPQFISDPTIINYVPPGPPQTYGAPFHPQGFQGYQPVNPVPGPELYHGGVTYYSPQTQMQRPHMMVPKRPKSVLHLVEPSKQNLRQGPRPHLPSQEEALLMSDMYLHQYREESLPHVVDYTSSSEFSATSTKSTTDHLAQKFEESVRLQPKTERVNKSPSPAPIDLKESPSWADQMADLTPLSSPAEPSSRKNSDFQGATLEKSGDAKSE